MLSIGKAASERVSRQRAELHEWIADHLTRSICSSDEYDATVYLGLEELLQEQYGQIGEALEKTLPLKGDSDAVLLVDLTANPYDLLPDPLLAAVGDVVTEWCGDGAHRSVIILIPVLPPRDASIFWPSVLDLVESGRLMVVQNDGVVVGAAEAEIAHGPINEYAASQARLSGSLESRISHKMLRKLGHFSIPTDDGPQCARFFFDCSLALDDITYAIVDYVRRRIMPARPSIVLMTHGPRSAWLKEAGLSAAHLLGAGYVDVSDPEAIMPGLAADAIGVCVFDVVNSGTTMRSVLRRLRAAGTPLASRAITVLLDRRARPVEPVDDVTLEHFARVDASKVVRDDCPQCRIGLSFTDPLVERQLTMRSFDAWDIFLQFPWVQEPYGPSGLQLFDEAPDLGAAINEYGDYLAYKIEQIVESLRPSKNLVFVCPEEPQIKKLADRLGPRFHDRYVAVHVPRSALEPASQTNLTEDRAAWEKQLDHLQKAESEITVVVIDEMNASSTTASSLIHILRSHGVEPRAYVPILDRDDMAEISGVPVLPVYSVPSPRRIPDDVR
ncbi:hypothetical protein ACQP2Y_15030 [Actinoplanes sp. CA-051413]|uniref:hypothetical protein n=1 Tax=Actinoplanes sp. CA-051413 TaxID=3239899 RepID=UPI003D98FE4B